ncbi:histone H2A.Z-like [Platysternon megacephalum]|uniref:Histone H2A.Z-like n=1 Tax=Platysternon megacephalum TaxID=55544 RepID=A0A4D9F741_9SAUR|nr:histone H2A.Z-like [Platysternon megacephalum]
MAFLPSLNASRPATRRKPAVLCEAFPGERPERALSVSSQPRPSQPHVGPQSGCKRFPGGPAVCRRVARKHSLARALNARRVPARYVTAGPYSSRGSEPGPAPGRAPDTPEQDKHTQS